MSQIVVPKESVSGERPFPRRLSFHCKVTGWKGQRSFVGCSYKSTDLIHEGSHEGLGF